jgi:hypothetical protein
MHRPFVTTVKFEVARYVPITRHSVDTPSTPRLKLERRFLDLEVDRYVIEKIVQATTLQARMLKLPPRCIMLLA